MLSLGVHYGSLQTPRWSYGNYGCSRLSLGQGLLWLAQPRAVCFTPQDLSAPFLLQQREDQLCEQKGLLLCTKTDPPPILETLELPPSQQ